MPETSFGWINWSVFIFYILGIFVIGSLFARRQTSTDEFFRAGKRMSWFPVMISLMASVFSAISFLGHPARIYTTDAGLVLALFVSYYFGMPLFVYAVLPFFRKLDITTTYEYLERRFSPGVRYVGSALFLFQRIFWMALVCLAPSLVLAVVLDLRVEYCILLIGITATVYTALGGMSAVIWTDLVQFFVLMTAQIMFFVIIIMRLDGGLGQILDIAVADNKFVADFGWNLSRPTFWTLLIGMMFLGLGFGVDQVNTQRIMSTRDETQARKSVLYQLVMSIPRVVILMLMGLSLYAFYKVFPGQLSPEVAQSPDKIVPYFILSQIPVGLCGLVIAGIFAAAMSSFDSGLNCLVAVFVVDWYKKIIRPGQDDSKYLSVSKTLTYGIGIAATLLALVIYKSDVKSIIDASNRYLGLFFGPVTGIFMVGICTRRAKPVPTLIAALVAFIVIIAIDLTNGYRTANDIEPLVSSYLYAPITLSITFVMAYVLSLFGPEMPYEKIEGFTWAKKRKTLSGSEV